MAPRAHKNTTRDPSANPFQALGEASPDPLSVAGGPRPSVVVESRAPTPSLFGASTSPFTGVGAGSLPFAANPPTAKRSRSDTSYPPGFTSKTDPKSYWVERFAAAAAAKENPSMDALVTTIAGFLAEIQADYLAQTDKLRSAIEYRESSGRRTHQGLNRLETRIRSLHQESPTPTSTPTPKPTSPAEAGPAPAAPHILAPKPTRPAAVPLWSQVAGRKAKKPTPPPPAKAPHTVPPAATSSPPAPPASQVKEITHRERRLLIKRDGTPLTSCTVAIRDIINAALQATLIQRVVCRPGNNLTLITMETVKAASLSSKVSSFLHLIPGTTTVRLDFPTVQIVVHGLPTDRSRPDIAQELTTFNIGLALSRPPRWLTPDDRRASKRISTVVLTPTGSRARDVASRNRLAAFYLTFKVVHHLRFNRYTQCHGCHQFGHHTLRCPNTPRCRWCAGTHSTRDHVCPTSTCTAKSRPCPHTLLKCVACAGPHEAHSAQCPERPAPEPCGEGWEDDEMH